MAPPIAPLQINPGSSAGSRPMIMFDQERRLASASCCKSASPSRGSSEAYSSERLCPPYFTSSANPLTISVKLTSRLNFTSSNSAKMRLPR
jgi:hypothetical protein